MKLKLVRETLGVPKGTIGEVIEVRESVPGSPCGAVFVKFDCKSEPIQMPWPCESHYVKEETIADPADMALEI